MKPSPTPAVVGAVARAIDVMDALARSPEGLELVAIARAVGMSPSGTHRTLRTLVDGGLVHQHEQRGHYQLGPKVLVWAQQMRTEAALHAAADPELAALSAEIGESIVLSVIRDRRMWTISSVEGQGHIVARAGLSDERLFHNTARGRLFLAHMDRAAARALVASTGLPAITRHTVSDEDTLWRLVDEIRRDGYADGQLAAALGVAVPMVRFDRAREAELVAAALRAARRIEQSWHPPAVEPPAARAAAG